MDVTERLLLGHFLSLFGLQNPLSNSNIAVAGQANNDEQLAERVRRRLNVYFATATCLSGMTLAGNPQTEMLPVIACLFAIVGLVFVDLLRWFSLPPIAAYLALGCIAFYSISRLMETGTGIADELQMVVVAELLVFVQAVLMVQRKNRRIYEQLAIFCLLELIVAAIFNDALSYGLLLVPLGIVGVGGLALLQTYGVTYEAFNDGKSGNEEGDTTDSIAFAAAQGDSFIRVQSADSSRSFRLAGLKLPRVTMVIFAPSVLLIAMLFFYGLPRTSVTASGGSGRVLVGFTDTVQLGQIGRMLQNDTPALRIELISRTTGRPYSTVDNLYLRGAVLETYRSSSASDGDWTALDARLASPTSQLPLETWKRSGWAGDDVKARITVEPSTSDALFSIPPYQRLATSPDVRHSSDRWLLARRASAGLVKANRMTYQFATSAFRDARQSRYVPRWDDMVYPETSGPETDSYGDRFIDRSDEAYRIMPGRTQLVRRVSRFEADEYIRRCLEYDEYRVPSAWRLSEELAKSTGPDRLQLAIAIEQFLISRSGFTYSLNQNSPDVPGLDPIEQFMSIHKQGNCQYFASAMTLMLRSQGIPARLVVGYSTDEFNSVGGFYIARQLHAHAWVEALIDTKWIPEDERYLSLRDDVDPQAPPEDSHGSPEDSDGYWVRLDPTPGGGGVERPDGGRVSDVFQLAQNIWIDYVVDRNASGSSRRDFGSEGSDAVASQYQSMFRWINLKLSQIQAGQLGGGALAIGRDFSWPAAIFGVIMTLVVATILQFRMPISWWRWRRRRAVAGDAVIPDVPFFAETIHLLRRVGIHRSASQTPLELTVGASQTLASDQFPPIDSPLRTLTDAFYDTRFSGRAARSTASIEVADEVAAALQEVRERIEMIESRSRITK